MPTGGYEPRVFPLCHLGHSPIWLILQYLAGTSFNPWHFIPTSINRRVISSEVIHPFWFFKCSFYSVFESQSKKVISLASILIHRMLISPRLLFGIMKLIFLERHNKKQPYDIYNCICSGDIIEATVCHIFKCSLHAVLWVISFKTEFYKVLLGLRYCKLSSFRQ